MFKTIIRILLICLLVIGLLALAGTTCSQFKSDIEFKRPKDVFNLPIPEIEEPKQPTIPEAYAENETPKPTEESPTEEPVQQTSKKDDLLYLIGNIKVSDGTAKEGYVRDDWEKPVKSYKLGDTKYNRNKYAWHVSAYLESEDPFRYKCPYTELVITDASTLDFEHIIPLSYIYKYGGGDTWTDEQKNEYAYNQLIGMDVLNKANRSHGDKGPSDWLPEKNIASYCYTWLVIANQYNISLRKIDLDVIKLECLNDLDGCVLINQFVDDSQEYQLQQEWNKIDLQSDLQ